MSIRNLATAAERAWAAVLVMITAPPTEPDPADTTRRREGPSSERGDVPGWVMITMMTAIVVIVLIGVFQDAVVNAVKNAFNSITGKG